MHVCVEVSSITCVGCVCVYVGRWRVSTIIHAYGGGGVNLFFCGYTTQFVGSYFSHQGLNLGPWQ